MVFGLEFALRRELALRRMARFSGAFDVIISIAIIHLVIGGLSLGEPNVSALRSPLPHSVSDNQLIRRMPELERPLHVAVCLLGRSFACCSGRDAVATTARISSSSCSVPSARQKPTPPERLVDALDFSLL
jgi:hypothetical protein